MRIAALLLLAACGPSAPAQTPLPSSPGPEATEPTTWSESKTSPKPVAAKPPAAKPPAAKPKAGPNLDPAAQAFVDAHNRMRAKHCAAPLTWSPTLATVAQNWANELARKGCVFGHSPGAKYGENLAAGTIGALDPESTVAMWYDEIKLYKFPDGGFSMQTGHFTQVVWTTTTQVGCGHVQCKGNDIYVCNYDPPGNWEGQYREHVLPTSCKK